MLAHHFAKYTNPYIEGRRCMPHCLGNTFCSSSSPSSPALLQIMILFGTSNFWGGLATCGHFFMTIL